MSTLDDDTAGGARAHGEDDDDLLSGPTAAGEDEEISETAIEADEEDEASAEALADAAAAGRDPDAIPASAKLRPLLATKTTAFLDPQARDGLIRCLQARITELDATLAHATAVAQKDTFYSRWPNVVSELRTQAMKRLEELQRS